MNRKRIHIGINFKIKNTYKYCTVILSIISIIFTSSIKKKSKLNAHSNSHQEDGGDLKLKEQLRKYDLFIKNQVGSNLNNKLSDSEVRFIEKSKNEIFNRQISQVNDVLRFFNSNFEANINKLPKAGQVDRTPWSCYFWPTNNGQISVRYNLNNRNSIGRFDYTKGTIIELYSLEQSINSYSQPEEYLKVLKEEPENMDYYIYDNFSPSEKYDLLVGDTEFTLTNYLKKYAKDNLKNYGIVPEWHGIGHGSALASYLYEKPKQQVVLTALDKKTQIFFMPEDIKALASIYMANSKYTINLIGGKNTNFSNILPTDQVLSVNPSDLLIILSNQVGIRRKNLIMDPLSDQEITNRAVIDYSVNYFNIVNENFYSEISSNKVNINDIKYSNDKFLRFLYRNSNKLTSHVLGIMFSITYANSVFPYHSPYPLPDNSTSEIYVGVIELDNSENLIGGQWKYRDSNFYPNFIWKIDEIIEDKNYDVKFDGVPNENIKNIAFKYSKNGEVLKGIVDFLISRARDEGWGYFLDENNTSNSISHPTENMATNETSTNFESTDLRNDNTSDLINSNTFSNISVPSSNISTTTTSSPSENSGFMDAESAVNSIRSALSGISGNIFRFDNLNFNNGNINSLPNGSLISRDSSTIIPARTPTPVTNSGRSNNEDFIANTLNLVRIFNNNGL